MGQLGDLNIEIFVDRINSSSEIVIDEGDSRMRHGTLNELTTLRIKITLIDSRPHSSA